METTSTFHRRVWGCSETDTGRAAPWLAEAGRQERCDIYVAYAGLPELQAVGFLVTAKGDPNELVAFCPVTARRQDSDKRVLNELYRGLRLALRIAAHPETAPETPECIWLGWIGRDEARAAPHWVYGLSCALLTEAWDGSFVHPQPFCPQRMRAMAEQPKALAWVKARRPQDNGAKQKY